METKQSPGDECDLVGQQPRIYKIRAIANDFLTTNFFIFVTTIVFTQQRLETICGNFPTQQKESFYFSPENYFSALLYFSTPTIPETGFQIQATDTQGAQRIQTKSVQSHGSEIRGISTSRQVLLARDVGSRHSLSHQTAVNSLLPVLCIA